MKRMLALILCLCFVLPGAALAQSLEDMLLKGADFMEKGDYNSAAICYDIALKLDPSHMKALAGLARAKAQQGDHEEALTLIESALAKEPANGQLYLAKAAILQLAGRSDEADLATQYAIICGAEPETSAPSQQGVNNVVNNLLTFVRNSETPKKDAQLAAAVANGSARLAPATTNLTGLVSSCANSFFLASQADIPAGLTPTPSADGLRVLWAPLSAEDAAGFAPVAVSPTGKVTLYNGDGMLYAVRDGEIIALTPNYAKAGEINKNQQYTLEPYPQYGRYLEQDSIAWSPDERYFALTFPLRTLQQMRYYDLIICDTLAGEFYLAEATPTKFSQDGAQLVTTAAFDPESKYVYYLAYGRGIAEGISALKRYELATGKAEVIYSKHDMFFYQPRLYVLKDGTVKAVSDYSKQSFVPGVITFSEKGGKWTAQEEKVSQPLSIQRLQRYLYAENSGHELILCRMLNETDFCYLTLNGDALMLPVGGSTCEKLPVSADLSSGRYLQVINAELSPDGHFALAATAEKGVNNLYLIDLETLTFAPVALPAAPAVPTPGSASQFKLFAWNGDGSVLLSLDKEYTLLKWE
ncbi:MAG: tetratricopeptide repeat protein [Clostridia bacterium]|nr:tetratricopeptide repeat protein [Clostridia bacterium]